MDKENDYAEQIKHNKNRLAKLRERIARTRNDITRIEKEIKKVEGAIAWDKNRSRQARTICERGF